jgi:ankyrin repeat protein
MPTTREVWNTSTNDKFTALHLACMGKHLEAVQVLIEQDGVDGNAQTALGVLLSVLRLACTSLQCTDLSRVLSFCSQVEK